MITDRESEKRARGRSVKMGIKRARLAPAFTVFTNNMPS